MLSATEACGWQRSALLFNWNQDNRAASVLHTASKGDMTGALRAHVQLLSISDQEVTLITVRRQVSMGLLRFSTSYEYDTNCSLLCRISVLEQRTGTQSAHYKRLGSPAQSAVPPVQSPVCGDIICPLSLHHPGRMWFQGNGAKMTLWPLILF